MVEQVALMRQLWTNELSTFDGEWHKIEASGINPLPIQRPIPVWVGAFAKPAIRRAAQIGDGWFVNPRLAPGDEADDLIETFREAAVKAGRDPAQLGMDATIHLGDAGSQEWAAVTEAWKGVGATHGTVRTTYSGFKTLDEHLNALRSFRDAVPA
jgi:alkanesulfonate monooxygenase SsuD/methylene tetrahydromethanopterin reductase-like flavin-dependent oxidoreductase (luciferase family)